MSWQPIVVGVDASPEAAEAAAFAWRTAERAGTTCQLVHATRDFIEPLVVPDAATYRQAVADLAAVSVKEALRGKVPASIVDSLIVQFGHTAAVLKQVASGVGAEVVVLGGKHRSSLGRWFAGSSSLGVARTTAVPMLVTAGAPTAIRRVLVAVDVSGAAPLTLAAAERFAGLFGAELRALSVLEPLPVIPEFGRSPDSTAYYALIEDLLRREVWPLITAPGVETLTRHGMAVETILREVTEWQADLLVVGSHGRSWAERVLVGSVTERLLNHLPTSLVVVPVTSAQLVESAAATHAAASA